MCHCGLHSYKYKTFIQVFQNDSVNYAACADPLKAEVPEIQIEPSVEDNKGKTVDDMLGSSGLNKGFH